MFLNFNNNRFYVRIGDENSLTSKKPVIFLHGFTGSSNDWTFLFDKLPLEYVPISIDLLGHGKSSSPKDIKYYSFTSTSNFLDFVFAELKLTDAILVGYSMGGRLALSYVISNPGKISKLVLESSTAGIEREEDRLKRIESDISLANTIESEGIEQFVNYWLSQPLFDTLKNIPINFYEKLKLEKLKNNPTGLANTLRGLGTGMMQNHWNKLAKLQTETLLISGELDKKFTQINRRMNSLLPHSNHKVVQNSGHNVHLEKPEEFVILLNEFLTD